MNIYRTDARAHAKPWDLNPWQKNVPCIIGYDFDVRCTAGCQDESSDEPRAVLADFAEEQHRPAGFAGLKHHLHDHQNLLGGALQQDFVQETKATSVDFPAPVKLPYERNIRDKGEIGKPECSVCVLRWISELMSQENASQFTGRDFYSSPGQLTVRAVDEFVHTWIEEGSKIDCRWILS